jgi:hypothetical protein
MQRPCSRAKLRLFLAMSLVALPILTGASAAADSRTDVAPIAKATEPPTGAGQGCTVPGNDNCASATVIAALPYSDAPNTECATDEAGEPVSTCTDAALSIWYSYTATALESVTVSLVGSDFDTTLMVWEGSCGAFTEVACNDDFVGLESQATFLANPGTTYYFQIAGFQGAFGNVALNVTSLVFPDCPTFNVDASFTGTNVQDGRLFRDGIGSTCANKPYPGNFGAGTPMNFETFTYPNPSPDPACVLINFDPNSGATPCATDAHLSAYAGSYNPLDQATNFLGDVGSSDTLPFMVTVPGATDLVLLANNNTGQVTCDFSFELIGVPCALGPEPPPVVEVPTLGQWGLGALAGLLAIAGFLAMRRNG